MQLTGTLFSDTSALDGNDIATFPDYPAEIRAPHNTVAGVSGFQVHIGKKIYSSGDKADVLVAMNPASLKANLKWVKKGGIIIVDADTFEEGAIEKAGYTSNPLEDDSLSNYRLIKAPITNFTIETVKDIFTDRKAALKCRNMFALGMIFFIFGKGLEHTDAYLEKKFAKKPDVVKANKEVVRAGYNFCENTDVMESQVEVQPAQMPKGKYRNITGNVATAWGLLAAAEKAGLPLFLGSYPITPATDIMVELPLVIVDVQRGGPCTGLPTKTEQSDLGQALFGRNGEAPCIVLAASSSANCFDWAFEAGRLALESMTPVILLSDGYLGNGSQLFRIPKMADLPKINPPFAKPNDPDYAPYNRDPETLVRQWAVPGMEGLRHRIGGLEKLSGKGSVSTDNANHQLMVNYRKEKVERVANRIPDQKVEGDENAELLVVGWGGTQGALRCAVQQLQAEGKSIAFTHFNYIMPLPKNTGDIMRRHKKIVVCELNMGQFANYLRMHFEGLTFHQYNKVQGLPFEVSELVEEFNKILGE